MPGNRVSIKELRMKQKRVKNKDTDWEETVI